MAPESDNAFDGLDRGAVALHREDEAAAHDLAVEPHRAGAAHAMLAADMGAGEREIVAQEIDQRLARFDPRKNILAVHTQWMSRSCWLMLARPFPPISDSIARAAKPLRNS